MTSKSNVSFELRNSEMIIKEGPASYFVGLGTIGGKLYLTNERLLFFPHKLNYSTKNSEIEISDISNVMKKKIFLSAHGLKIILSDNRNEEFLVYGRKKWISAINELIP